MNTRTEVEAFIKESRDKGRICPVPNKWNDLYKYIKMKTGGEGLPLPIILGGWYEAPYLVKMLCFEEQLNYAYNKGIFENVKRFLDNLSDEEWYCGEDKK